MSTIKEQRVELEKLLNMGNSQPVPQSIDNAPIEDLNPEPLFDIDYEKEMRILRKKARLTLNKIIRLSIPEKFRDNDYIMDKKEQDIQTLSALYWQERYMIIMQQSMGETIRLGGGSPRYFEVFAAYTNQIQSLQKQIMSTESILRKTYTELKFDVQSQILDEGGELLAIPGKQNDKLLNTGSKDMINKIKTETFNKIQNNKSIDRINKNNIEDVDFSEN